MQVHARNNYRRSIWSLARKPLMATFVAVLATQSARAEEARNPGWANMECYGADCTSLLGFLQQNLAVVAAAIEDVGEATTQEGQPPERAVKMQLVSFKIDSVLSGGQINAGIAPQKTIAVRAFQMPEMTKVSEGPWTPWVGMPLQKGRMFVLVLKAPAQMPGIPSAKSGEWDAVWAGAIDGLDDRRLKSVEAAVKHYGMQDAALRGKELDNFLGGKDKLLFAYALAVLTRDVANKDLSSAVRKAADALKNWQLDAGSQVNLAVWLAIGAYSLPDDSNDRKAIVGALVAEAAREGAPSANAAGLAGLGKLLAPDGKGFKEQIRNVLVPAAIRNAEALARENPSDSAVNKGAQAVARLTQGDK